MIVTTLTMSLGVYFYESFKEHVKMFCHNKILARGVRESMSEHARP